ncbi:MAG: YqgE/AlgH family protein [Dongiaceae bacterium]
MRPACDPGRRAALGLLLLAAAAPAAARAATGGEAPGAPATLAGRLLVASEAMRDPGFAETVIVMASHDAQGALGFVVNRPGRVVSIAELAQALGLPLSEAQGGLRVFAGGPVQPERGFLLHSPDVMLSGSRKLAEGVALTAEAAALQAIASGKGPARRLFVFGYCGWDKGQLEAELGGGDWFDLALDPALVFADEPERLWQQALDRRQTPL